MSNSCAIIDCKRVSRALCHCCQQNLCISHLNEHNDLLNSQLNPLIDEINTLGERLKTLNINDVLDDCRQKLEQWRYDCHKKIDNFVDQKLREIDLLVSNKSDEQRKVITHTQSKLANLIQDQAATWEDIDTLTSTIHNLEEKIKTIEQLYLLTNIRPLLIDDTSIQVNEAYTQEFDLSTFSTIHKAISYNDQSSFSLANNDRVLLIHCEPNLCLVDAELTITKQVLWPHEHIFDSCWSSALDRFILIVKDNIFLVDENTTSINRVETVEKRNWFACTCSINQLFLTTNTWGSSIIQVSLSPSIAVIKEWKSPKTCTSDEVIHSIIYNHGRLGILIKNKVKNSVSMELRSCTTLDCLWSLTLDIAYEDIKYRCCSLDCNGWLIADHGARRLLHITRDGKMKEIVPYKDIPYGIIQFGTNMFAISTKSKVNFHKMQYKH